MFPVLVIAFNFNLEETYIKFILSIAGHTVMIFKSVIHFNISQREIRDGCGRDWNKWADFDKQDLTALMPLSFTSGLVSDSKRSEEKQSTSWLLPINMFTDSHIYANDVMNISTAIHANKQHDEMQCYTIIFTFTLESDSDNHM